MPVSQAVFDQIIGEIRDGRLRPGDRLPSEHELVALFDVGRSSIREALRGLATLGLIESRPRRGAIVAMKAESPLARRRHHIDIDALNRRALLDLLEVREALEGKTAEFAARRATAADIREMRKHHAAVERDVAAGRSYFKSNAAFHRAVAAAAHNAVLADSIHVLTGQVRDYRERLMREIPFMPEQDVREHEAVLRAIASAEPERARQAMIAHIHSFAELVARELEADAA